MLHNKSQLFLASLVLSLSFLSVNVLFAQSQNSQKTIEYNATDKSPTLPLAQTPPPQNHPNSVSIGTPSYYYYYAPPTVIQNSPQAGVSISNSGGTTNRSFWYTSPAPSVIPGQIAPTAAPNLYMPYYTAPTNNGILYIP